MTALAAISVYLPEQRVPVEDLAERLRLTPMQVKLFRRYHGLGTVSRAPEPTPAGMLLRAAANLDGLADQARQVRYVLYARGMPAAVPYPLNPLHEVVHALGLSHALAFTVTHHTCATSLLAVDIAGRLLAADADPDALALVLAGEKAFTRDAELVPETSIFAENAAACLVRAGGERDRMLAYVTQLRGEFDSRLLEDPDAMYRYQRAYPELLAEVIVAAVDRAGLRLSDLRLILPHNVNAVSWRQLSRRIDYPRERILLDNVATVGHSFAADAFINYRTALDRGLLRPGDHVLIAAAGLGATFSAMVFQH